MLVKPERNPQPKPSPLLNPDLLSTLPFSTRMYVIGNFVRDIIQYIGTQLNDEYTGQNKSLVNPNPRQGNKQVKVVTKPTEPATTAPNLTGSKINIKSKNLVGSISKNYGNENASMLVENMHHWVQNNSNPINSFFNFVGTDTYATDAENLNSLNNKVFTQSTFQKRVAEILEISSNTFGIDLTEIWKQDVQLIEKAIKTYQDFVLSENGVNFNPSLFSTYFKEIKEYKAEDIRKIVNSLNTFEKNSYKVITEGIEALENLMKPILNLNKGHAMNDQSWLLSNTETGREVDLPVGTIHDVGEVVDRNNPMLLRNIKVKNNRPTEIFTNLLRDNLSSEVIQNLIGNNKGKILTSEETLLPSYEQFVNIFEDLGYNVKELLSETNNLKLNQAKEDVIANIKQSLQTDNVQNKTLLEGVEELFEALVLKDNKGDVDLTDRFNKIRNSYSKIFGSLYKGSDSIPNVGYQLFNNVERLQHQGYLLGTKELLANATPKERALIFLNDIIMDGSVNKNFKNVEAILKSIIAEDPLDIHHVSDEALNFGIFDGSNYNDPVATKSWINDAFLNKAHNNKALIEHIVPNYGSSYLPTKSKYSKFAEMLKEVPEELKTIMRSYADNLGIDYMIDSKNFNEIKNALIELDPSAFPAYNKYYEELPFKDETLKRKLINFKPSNWQDLTNIHVNREVQRFINSHPNLDKKVFTDKIIRKGITSAGTIDENSELFNLLTGMREQFPDFIYMLEAKIAEIAENAQDVTKYTMNAFNNMDAKHITSLMNKKYNVASHGQMLVAAQQVLKEKGKWFQLTMNPSITDQYATYTARQPVFSPFKYSDYLYEGTGGIMASGYPDMLVGNLDKPSASSYNVDAGSSKFADIAYSSQLLPENRKYTLNGLIDELMLNKVDVVGNIVYPVIDGTDYSTIQRNQIIDLLQKDLIKVLSDPDLSKEFVKLTVSSYGDKMPLIVDQFLDANEGNEFLKDQLVLPGEARKISSQQSYKVTGVKDLNTIIELPDGTVISNKLDGMTVTYNSPFSISKNSVGTQNFNNHIFASAAKEIGESGYAEIAEALLKLQGAEVDNYIYFDKEVLNELKKILITPLDRFNGGEGAVITSTTGLESPGIYTQSTLKNAAFDTLQLAVLDGAGTRGEITIVQDGMKVLDMSKWAVVTRNNAAKNSITIIPGQGEKVMSGSLQHFQSPIGPPTISTKAPSQLAVMLTADDLQELEDTGFFKNMFYNWLDGRKTVTPVDGKYIIDNNFAPNSLPAAKGPTNIDVNKMPISLSSHAINEYLKTKTPNDPTEIVDKKNFIIQTMQKSAQNLQNFIDGKTEYGNKAVAYFKVDELLKMVEDNRLQLLNDGGPTGMDNVYDIAKSMGKEGYKVFQEKPSKEMWSKIARGQVGKVSDADRARAAVPIVRFNPNNNAMILIEGNHRVQAMNIWGIDYMPVIFELDPYTIKTDITDAAEALNGLGTNNDVTARISAGMKFESDFRTERYNPYGIWKKLARYIIDPEINKSMLNPVTSVTDYTLHPKIGQYLYHAHKYDNAFQVAQNKKVFESHNDTRLSYLQNFVFKMKHRVDDFASAVDNIQDMEDALQGMAAWINRYGLQKDKEKFKLLLKYHPKGEDFAAMLNSISSEGRFDIDIFETAAARLKLDKSTYENLFNEHVDLASLKTTTKGGHEFNAKDSFAIPVQTQDFQYNTDGGLKLGQFIEDQHHLFENSPNLAKNFIENNLDILGPGNIKSINQGVDYITVKPTQLEVAGVSAQRTVHSSNFDDILQVIVDAGIMTPEDAVQYKTVETKSWTTKLFENLSKFEKERLQYLFQGQYRYATHALTKAVQPTVSAIKDDVLWNTVKGLQWNVYRNSPKYARDVGRLKTFGQVADTLTVLPETLTLFATTQKFYDDPDFGAATGLGRYGIGGKELMQELLPFTRNKSQGGQKFQNDGPVSALLKAGINGLSWIARNTYYRDIEEDPTKYGIMVQPEDYDPELHGKNLRQLIFGFDPSLKGFVDGPGGTPWLKHKQKQPQAQGLFYLLAKGLAGGTTRYIEDGQYNPKANVQKIDKELYENIGKFVSMEEENGN